MSASRGRSFFTVCGAVCGYALGYAAPTFARLPNLYYDPIAHRFLIGERPGPIPMGYLGQILWGLGASLLGAVLALVITSLPGREPGAQAYRLAAAWTMTAVGVVGAYFTWNNWP